MTLGAKVETEFDFGGFAKLTEVISSDYSTSLSYGFSYIEPISIKNEEQIYVDGTKNPFGGYTYCYCTVSATQNYFFIRIPAIQTMINKKCTRRNCYMKMWMAMLFCQAKAHISSNFFTSRITKTIIPS